MFILAEKTQWELEFYKGKTYINQGEYYPVVDGCKSGAKTYISKSRAVNACEKLNKKAGRCFKVEELFSA